MKSKVDAISFLSREGLRLYGILHEPEEAKKTGIIILNPGVKSRVGPHRLYVKMARKFSELGFLVLRFDPHGIGDSEGEIKEQFALDFYGTVQIGRFVGDTVAAMDWMEKKYGIHRFVLAGLCGGAITALHAGAIDNRVVFIVGLGMPVILNGSHIDPNQYMSLGQIEQIRKGYLGKLASVRAWLRFLSLRSDYQLILRSFSKFLKAKLNYNFFHKNATKKNQPTGATNLNPLFSPAIHKFASSRRILLIFSGADRLHFEFEEKYRQNYSEQFLSLARNIDVHIIEMANHILSFMPWQDEMIDKVSEAMKSSDNVPT